MFVSVCVYKTKPALHPCENGISKVLIVSSIDVIRPAGSCVYTIYEIAKGRWTTGAYCIW
jgi:hypothetical protein